MLIENTIGFVIFVDINELVILHRLFSRTLTSSCLLHCLLNEIILLRITNPLSYSLQILCCIIIILFQAGVFNRDFTSLLAD
jgi:hypothetical protein